MLLAKNENVLASTAHNNTTLFHLVSIKASVTEGKTIALMQCWSAGEYIFNGAGRFVAHKFAITRRKVLDSNL